ncbi:integrase arm-type DNA-binding domain-containing protein [Methylotenera sp.]|uniref:tyrosine-type recombinase/integrase n=1 Tax=Methylotenera sp. TaxID=2051956 RepID=UPI0024893747|nr:integrase arm-type DNA-binding domain-containing protein [Methylotenera sp.]MDI1298068.1 integrase arm-type DNA-binding domain-containing protein [Methylotenera sp.]
MAKKLSNQILDDLTIRAAKPKDKQYTVRDGNGLFLLVHPNGSKYFQLRTTLNGKPKLLQLGIYPDLTLAEARRLAMEKRRMVADNLDPVIEAKLEKAQAIKDADATFRSVAEVWLDIKKHTLAQTTHLKIAQTFNANVYSKLGSYPICKIDNHMVRDCLLVMQKRGALEIMEKTRGWIKQVFDFALSDKMISENPIPVTDLRLKKHVGEKFPRLKSANDAGKLLRNLTDYAGSFEVSTCVYLMINLAQRPSELRCAKWVDFDLEKAIWTIPLEQSKTRKHMTKPHTVMLSRQAIEVLKELKHYTGHSEYAFSSRLARKPVSEATIRKAFRLNFTDYHIVPHGCRHFFSTQANESGLFRNDVIEAALSHGDKDKIRGIYNEATYDRERKQLAQWWSDQLDIMRDGTKVIPFKKT